MAKLTLADVADLRAADTAVTTINNNFTAIENAIENTLSRDGSIPNTMGSDLDLNSNDILNAGRIDTVDLFVDGIDVHEISGPPGPEGPPGEDGEDGATLNPRGSYSGATAYAKYDVVLDQSSSWIALVATTGNAPPTLPTTSNTQWQLLAAKGSDGVGLTDGDKGDITVASSGASFTIDNGVVNANKLASDAVTTVKILDANVTLAKVANGTALSVVGNATNASAVHTDIAAGSDHQVMRRSGTSIGFGAVNLAQSAAVTGVLPEANLPDASTTAQGVIEIATSAEYRTGTDTTRSLGVAETWGAMAEVALTDAATIAWDMATGIDFTVTLGGNRTLGNPTNTKVGQRGRIRVVQDGTGSRTLTKSSNHKTVGGAALSLSTAAASVDYIDYDVVSSTNIRLSLSKAWS